MGPATDEAAARLDATTKFWRSWTIAGGSPLVRSGHSRLGRRWLRMERIVESQATCAEKIWREPNQGIWEARGRPQHYGDLMERLLHVASPLGLYAEEYEAGSGRLIGNFPQAFSHLALIEAAARIIVAERLRELGG
jgi:GH15 family glucan-1,4-alpha-glucosidase